MAVTSTTALSGPYTADGSATVFPFDFAAMSADDVAVVRIAADGTETAMGGYSVTLVPGGGGSAAFGSAPVAGDPIFIYSNPSFEQQIGFENQGSWSPASMNAALDRAAARDIALKALMSRTALVPLGETIGPLPPLAERRNAFLQFDNNGNPTPNASIGKGDPGSPGEGYPTRTALAAIAHSALDDVYLAEAGRQGKFTFDSTNHSAHVAADTAQGLFIAPASDATGASGAWVRQFSGSIDPAWFGVIEGDVSANGAANTAAFAAMLATLDVAKRYTIAARGGTYWFANNGGGAGIDVTSGALVIDGGGAGGNDNGTGAVRAIFKFAAGITGIRVQGAQTSGGNTKDGATHADARGTVLRNLVLQGGFTTAEGEHHGIQSRTRITCENVTVLNFEGDGFYVGADGGAASGASPPFGNANVCRLINCTAQGNRNGMFFDGDNANACVIVSPNLNSNRQWGDFDSSGFGNTYVGGQIATNGATPANDGVIIPASVVSSGGNYYGAIVGQEAWCSTNAPSGTTADNQGWYYMSAGAPAAGKPAWFNGIIVRAGGAAHTDSGVGASQFTGVYAEGDQGKAQIWEPSLVLGGILATWCFQNTASPGTAATPLIRGGQNNGGLIHMEPALEVVSGVVTTTVGGTLANANNRILMMQHPTFAPGVGYQLEFASGGSTGDIRFTYQDGTTNVWWVTTPTTTAQFGTGAAVPHAFSPLKLMLQDNASAIGNARRLMVDTAAPASGAHAQGEFVHYRGATAGQIGFICRVAGSPGTWDALYCMTAAIGVAYTAWTGTANRGTKDTATATLVDVAQTLKALIDDLKARAVI